MKKGLHFSFLYNKISKCQSHGSLVKRLRRRPLTAETRVRFPDRSLKSALDMKTIQGIF